MQPQKREPLAWWPQYCRWRTVVDVRSTVVGDLHDGAIFSHVELEHGAIRARPGPRHMTYAKNIQKLSLSRLADLADKPYNKPRLIAASQGDSR